MSVLIRFATDSRTIQQADFTTAINYMMACFPGCYCERTDDRVLFWTSRQLASVDDGQNAFAEITNS